MAVIACKSEELLGEEAARQLLETEEHCREVEQLQQQQDEYLHKVDGRGLCFPFV